MLKHLDRYKLLPFVQYFWLWIAISAIAILIGIGAGVYNAKTIGYPLNRGIDFTGGDLIELRLKTPGNARDVVAVVAPFSEGEALVQPQRNDPRDIEIRMRVKVDTSKPESQQSSERVQLISDMVKAVEAKFGGPGTAVILREEHVGPVVGAELIRKAIWALFWGSIVIMIYIFIRFNMRFRYAFAGIVSLLHDVLIALGGAALLRLEINSFFIAVILTIIGYSIMDTIIVYDRIRENEHNFPQLNFPTLINLSITQTLTRSLATVTTVIIMLLALLLFGGPPVYSFSMALLIGVVSGMYSSIFIAAPIVLWFTPGKRRVRIPRYIDFLAAQEQAAMGTYDEDGLIMDDREYEEVEEVIERAPAVPSRKAAPARSEAPTPSPKTDKAEEDKRKKLTKKARKR
jgi:preprotein translocase subunit SecF